MVDRSDQARQNAGPRISINGLEGSARERCSRVPSSLRASAPPQPKRWAAAREAWVIRDAQREEVIP